MAVLIWIHVQFFFFLVLCSDEFASVMEAALDAVLEAVLEDLSKTYSNPEIGIPLAKLLPPVASAGSTLMDHPDDNRFIQLLARLPQVQSFCAMVYSSNS
jgi:peroxin-3